MGDFKKGNRFGGGGGGGFKGGARRDFSRPMEMHQATCASCNKSCEVPFRPNGQRPVYCKECFASSKGEAPSTFSRPPFTQRPSFRSGERQESAPTGGGIAELKSHVEKLSAKIDTLMRMVEELAAVKKEPASAKTSLKSTVRKIAKKAAKK